MTTEQKKAKILAAAASFGHHADIYWKEAKELEAAGLIHLVGVKTQVGNTVQRWKLAA